MKFGRFHVQVYTIIYERWGTKQQKICEDAEVLNAYADEVLQLKDRGKYQYADLDALNHRTPKLDRICEDYGKEHHHLDDEVRFVVEGNGVFEVISQEGDEKLRI